MEQGSEPFIGLDTSKLKMSVAVADAERNGEGWFFGDTERDGSYEVFGGFGDDTLLRGGRQNDILSGKNGVDGLYGGDDDDVLIGKLGADFLTGGSGADVFRYGSAAESTTIRFDTIDGFNISEDRIDLPDATGWYLDIDTCALSIASFGSDLRHALGTALGSYLAVSFTPDSGGLAGRTFLVIDGDGVPGYTPVQEYVIEFTNFVLPLEPANIFI